ncbi:hypothetical protein [Micromonospora sp. WMMD1082]|uniref:hypothetical protein n=1 Tax=Micromonospora sp. WMMD1082 TaxID=3016104 RepID=UPI00241625A2|nr:hypothetical protein [Micromonospora sp. WMMD1082]MDG4797189.1 hypothetical protein [Micromonospora sp. WMMD1082]
MVSALRRDDQRSSPQDCRAPPMITFMVSDVTEVHGPACKHSTGRLLIQVGPIDGQIRLPRHEHEGS